MSEDLEVISDEDLAAPLQLAANYKKLAAEFEDVAKEATAMKAKLEGQDATVSELNQQTKALQSQLTKLEEANKKAAKSTKDYGEAANFADKQTGGLLSRVKETGKQFLSLLATPIGAFFLLISGALASIAAYFKNTNDGADKFEKIMASLQGVADFLLNKIVALGEQIVKMFEDGNALGTVFGFIFDQVINRIAGAIDAFTSLLKIINILAQYDMKALFTGNLKPEDLKSLKSELVNLGKAGIQAFTGIGTAADEAAEKIKSIQSLTEAADKLGDEIRDRILSKAQALLDIEEQLFIFKDKGNHTDQQRLTALNEAIKISEDQLKVDIDLATRKERLFTAELLHKKGIINTEQEANKILASGTTLLQDQLLEHKAIDSELEERRKLQADILNLQRDFFAENKKNIAQLAALQKEIDEESIKRAEIETAARIKLFDEQLQAAKNVEGSILIGFKSNLDQKADLEKRFQERVAEDQKKFADQKKERDKEAARAELEEFRRKEQEKQAIIQAAQVAITELGNAYFNNQRDKLNEQSANIEAQRKAALEAAGDDAVKRLAIDRKYDRQQAQIKTKQAQADKQQALFNILISTAAGIARVAPNPVLIALVAAIGAVQAALVGAKPIPKFAGGTSNSPSTFIAGEAGREIVERNGKAILADKPTLFMGAEGSKVFTNKQTEEMLGNVADVGYAARYGSRVRREVYSSSIVAEKLNEGNKLLKRIASKPDIGLLIDADGFSRYVGNARRRDEIINSRFYGR